MKKTLFIFGLFISAILLLFNLSKYTLLSGNIKTELIIAFMAIAFFFLGIVFYKKMKSGESQENHKVDYHKLKQLQITDREYDVLKELAHHVSNREIAERLFLSESTIKTHISSLLKKLEAKNRIQLTEKAKKNRLL